MVLLQVTFVRMGLALLLGACLGATRLSHLGSAGIGVHALVALGSSLFTVIALVGFTSVSHLGQAQSDPTRLVAWILLGSGLLGASSLLGQRERRVVLTLFTAVTCWAAAAIGVLCGVGWLSEGMEGTVLVVSIFLLSRLITRLFSSR